MARIYCRERNGMHDFYLVFENEEFYLFSQKFKRGVDHFYRKGVLLNKGISHGIGKTDRAIHHTIDKVKRHIKYIENEYDLIILNQTRMRANQHLDAVYGRINYNMDIRNNNYHLA